MNEPSPIRPATLRELEQVVAWAVAEETALRIAGADTKGGFGRPVDAEQVLSTNRLAGIDLYEPEELVMSAGAGTPLAEIEAQLAAREQMLAFEPPDLGPLLGGAEGRQTIGGVFACNLSGPRRIKSGAARDHLLGLQCVTGHGKIVKTGGRVMKNVTGYDMCKLLTGSFGTLAVISHLTFRTLPAAAVCTTLMLAGAPTPVLLQALREAFKTPFEPAAAATLEPRTIARSKVLAGSAAVALIRLEGARPSVEYRSDALRRSLLASLPLRCETLDDSDTRALWREIRDVRLLDPAALQVWRVVCPPTSGVGILDLVRTMGGEAYADQAGGLVWATLPAPLDSGAELFRAALEPFGGHATLVKAPEAVRRTISVFHPLSDAVRRLTERLKASFDPRRIFERGRMYAEI